MNVTLFFSLSMVFGMLEGFNALQAAQEKNLIEITSVQQFNQLKQRAKPIVLEFYADWCGACSRAKKTVKNIAAKNNDIFFLLANTDAEAIGSIKKDYNPTAYPTFIFLDASGNQVDRISGASNLNTKVQQLKK